MPQDLKELGKKGANCGNCVHIVGVPFEETEDYWDPADQVMVSAPFGWKCPVQAMWVTDACICHSWQGPAPGTELVPIEPVIIEGH